MPAFADKLEAQADRGAGRLILHRRLTAAASGAKAEIEASRVIIHQTRTTAAGEANRSTTPIRSTCSSSSKAATITSRSSTATASSRSTASNRVMRCMAGRSIHPDGRYVYFASRDGWISKFDMYTLEMVAEIRAGINTRNLAVSGDGRYVMVGNYLPHTLVVLDADDLSLVKIIDVKDDTGKQLARQRRLYRRAAQQLHRRTEGHSEGVGESLHRRSTADLSRAWCTITSMGEGIAEKGPFPVRRIELDDYLDDFFFDQAYQQPDRRVPRTAARPGGQSDRRAQDRRRRPARHAASRLGHHLAISRTRTVLATPNLKEGVVSVIDMKTGRRSRRSTPLGPGFFMRSHENTPYAWVDVFFGPNKDVDAHHRQATHSRS